MGDYDTNTMDLHALISALLPPIHDKPNYLSTAHEANSKAVKQTIQTSKIQDIDWEQEIERQRKNAARD